LKIAFRVSSLVIGCQGMSFGWSWVRSGGAIFGRFGGGWNNSCRRASAFSSVYIAFVLPGPLDMGGVG
jgi:hypothetical protein